MAISRTTVYITTDGAGAFSKTVKGRGFLRSAWLDTGDLSTPDLTLTDAGRAAAVLTVAGVAADTLYYPSIVGGGADGVAVTGSAVPPYIVGNLTVTVAGGGATKSGVLVLVFER